MMNGSHLSQSVANAVPKLMTVFNFACCVGLFVRHLAETEAAAAAAVAAASAEAAAAAAAAAAVQQQ